ncbi:MAG: sulfite exporter TauE/SafE family protein [Cyanobacteria bacterium]|nr:sulfite exporter TauE/SafE family protein [Cyanobacteriota bacterium]MDW8201667.1 sulfite exporter TauE/SafE family protein [Cyanobacteriota bacterium SKYGB_h_bin112]
MSLLLLGLVSFVAWFISMLAGGGSPLVLIPLVNILYGSQAVAPVITIGMSIGNAQRTLFFWRAIDWKVTLWHLPGSLLGSVLGCLVFTQIHLEWLQVVIAIALILMAGNFWFGDRQRPFQVRAWQFMPLAFLNAFGSGLIGSTGPILNPLYLNYGLEKERMIATKSVNVVIIHVVKIAVYLSLGVLNWPYVAYGLLIGFASMPANWLGKLVLDRMSSDQFRRAVLAFVAFSGVFMLWQQRELLLVW